MTYTTIALYNIGQADFAAVGEKKFLEWIGIIFLSTVFLPFLAILVFRLAGLISDAFMHVPKDRILPLVGTLIFYVWAYYYFEHIHAPLLLKTLLLGAIFSIIIDLFINFSYKVSVHTTSAGMMPGNILVLMMLYTAMPVPILLFAILAALLVGLIRWWLGAHTLGQILLGYAVGISMQWVAYLILK